MSRYLRRPGGEVRWPTGSSIPSHLTACNASSEHPGRVSIGTRSRSDQRNFCTLVIRRSDDRRSNPRRKYDYLSNKAEDPAADAGHTAARLGITFLSSHHSPLRYRISAERPPIMEDIPDNFKHFPPCSIAITHNPDPQFAAIWNAAIRRYQADTGLDLSMVSRRSDSPIESADELWELVDSEQSKFEEYRSRGQSIRACLKPVLDNIELVSERVADKTVYTEAVVVHVYPWQPGEDVFKAIKLLFDIAAHDSAHYEIIIGVFQRIRRCLDQCTAQRGSAVPRNLGKRLVEVLALVLVIVGLVTKQMMPTKFSLKLFVQSHLKKKVERDDVQDALGQLEYLTNKEGSVLPEDIQ
ncbi:hypothetical protein EVG20_g4671 [Dentipellis fragilis]|uniref:Fungal STAND N-terminal Goodbye domain-containing protein n=1 Tax=Dentipellis fragilis TaxID=205917 RepID=A0A4Y9YXE3_9AGAM|nr:hypothetical protein EVG20_g4671 [Dentipellis fragilis]